MRKIPIHMITALVIVVALGVTLAAFSSAGQSRASVSNQPSLPNGKTQITYAPGSPAIQPHLNAIPSYTTADVEQYIKTYGFRGGPTTTKNPPTILKIEFITSQQANTLLNGEFIGRPDSSLVCYVELQGPFIQGGPHPPTAQIPTFNVGIEIFDAQTGNILLWN